MPGKEHIFRANEHPVSVTRALTTLANHHESNSSSNSVSFSTKSDKKGLLLLVKTNLSNSGGGQSTCALCDLACSLLRRTRKLARNIKLKGRPICLTVSTRKCSQEVVLTHIVELRLPRFDGSREIYHLSPYLEEHLSVGIDVIVPSIDFCTPCFAKSHKIQQLLCGIFSGRMRSRSSDRWSISSPIRKTPRLPLRWVLSSPLPTSSGLIVTCFKANTNPDSLPAQPSAWYDNESFKAMNQLDPRSTVNKQAEHIDTSTIQELATKYKCF